MRYSTKLTSRVLQPLLIIGFLFFISESCTVTKRVHRKGWHVEWRKVKRTAAEDISVQGKKESKEADRLATNQGIQENTAESIEVIQLDEKRSSRSIELNTVESIETDSYTILDSPEAISLPEETPSVEQSRSEHRELSTQESKESRNPLDGLAFGLALIFFIFAIICAGLGMLLLLWIQAITSSALIIILGIFMFGIWLIGFISLIAAFAGLISGIIG